MRMSRPLLDKIAGAYRIYDLDITRAIIPGKSAILAEATSNNERRDEFGN